MSMIRGKTEYIKIDEACAPSGYFEEGPSPLVPEYDEWQRLASIEDQVRQTRTRIQQVLQSTSPARQAFGQEANAGSRTLTVVVDDIGEQDFEAVRETGWIAAREGIPFSQGRSFTKERGRLGAGGLDPDFCLSLSEDEDPRFDAARFGGFESEAIWEQQCQTPPSEETPAEVPVNEPKKADSDGKVKLGDVLFYALLVLLVVGAFVLFGGSSGGPRMIAGYSAFTVKTGSMHDVLPQGSLIVTKQVDPQTLQIGDDITYMTSETASITHRIIGIVEEDELTGERAFETKGTMNERPDAKLVPAVNVVGKVVFCSSALGTAVRFIQDNWPLLIFFACIAGGLAIVLKRILRE